MEVPRAAFPGCMPPSQVFARCFVEKAFSAQIWEIWVKQSRTGVFSVGLGMS